MTESRPTPLPRRRKPVPAPDEEVDPVVPAAQASRPAQPPTPKYVLPVDVPRRRRGAPMVQLNTRVPPDIGELVDRVVESTSATKADVVEAAIRHAYGSQE